MLMLRGFVALCSLAGILAGNHEGGCGDIKSLKNFDLSKYMGTWYQNGVVNLEPAIRCLNYTWFAAPPKKILMNSYGSYVTGLKPAFTLLREIRVFDASEPGQLTITNEHGGYIINRSILGTDYTTYSVEYYCKYIIPSVWIVTRQPNPPQSVIDEGIRVIREHGITIEKYNKVDQSCWISEEGSSEEKTTTKVPKTEASPESTEAASQRPITENEEEKVAEQKKPRKPFSLNQILNIDIEITF